MPTAVSSSTSYCDVPEFLKRNDARPVGDCLRDDNQRVPPNLLSANPNIIAALMEASGEVEAACLVGEKYSPGSLQALTGVMRDFLRGLVSDLAMWKLQRRRWPGIEMTASAARAFTMLERIRLGERIFGLQENMDAGNPQTQVMDESAIQNLNLTTTQSERLFGTRSKANRFNFG